ncbi:Oxidation resistance protein [Globisporangium polare]
MAANSIRALFQSLFVDDGGDDDGSNNSGGSSAGESPPQRRLGSDAIPPSSAHARWAAAAAVKRRLQGGGNKGSADDDGDVSSEPPCVPHATDGEYTAWFQKRPLGMGLVPSTQLYGSWEVSSVSAAISHPQEQQQQQQSIQHVQYGDGNRKHRIGIGDVLIAVNHSCRKAQLPRNHLAQYLQECTLPIAVTLRKPAIYGSFDSRSVVTAMYPLSIEYEATKEFAEHKRFLSRVSSAQWKRTLQHELSQNAVLAKSSGAKKLADTLTRIVVEDENSENQSPSDRNTAGSTELTSEQVKGKQVNQMTESPKKVAQAQISKRAQLSPMGEFDFTFSEHPIHLVLAPSTRMYGSVEVYEPKVHFPDLQVGDVVMAVNGDASVSRWATDDLIDFIAGLQPPVTIRFRRPTAYRKYLEKYFVVTKRTISSQSVASAMFPQSAEYKKSPPKSSSSRERMDSSSSSSSSPPPPATLRQTKTQPSMSKVNQVANKIIDKEEKDDAESAHAKLKSDELRSFSLKIDSTDQFKLWNGGGRDGAAPSSSILTEKHVRFLWTQLPPYLACNEMELAYSTRYHGWNSLSFYAKLADKGPTILVVQDTRDNIFGAFCSTSWKHSTSIYGNGRSFVFTLRPQMRVFPWSGLESSFMYSRKNTVFVGGGKKGIALCLQLDEMRGFTKQCETFDSPPLADRENFDCEICEVWSFSGLRI